jgi:hypothetical protein
MARTNVTEFTVERENENGRFWVNGKFNCLGRFTPNGYEVYREFFEDTDVIGTTHTLAVRVHNTKPLDWNNFRALMKEHHGIDLSGEEYPDVQKG